MTIDASILSLYANMGSTSSASSAESVLLNALYGNSSSGTAATSTESPVQALLSAQRNEASGIKTTEQQPQVKTAIAAFTKAVSSATSLTAALNNPAVLNVLLTANGMTDQIGNTALATKVLTSDLNDPNSLANVLTDTRWKTLAQTYDFAVNGLKVLQNPATVAAITQGYAQITWENAQNASTPGISDALTFIQQAGSITSVDGILGNATARTVVTTALGIPQQIAFQSLTAQEQAISSRFDVKNLQDPTFVQNFAERYLIMNNLNSGGATSSSTDLTTLASQLQASTIL